MLFDNINISDRTFSQLPKHMKSHLIVNNMSESILSHLWLDKLPTTMVQILTPIRDDTLLNKVIDIADKSFASFDQRLNTLTPKQENDCIAKDHTLIKSTFRFIKANETNAIANITTKEVPKHLT